MPKSSDPNRPKPAPTRGRADLARLRHLSEAEIAESSPDELRDIPENFWRDARIVAPVPKEAISIRLDRDVIAYFRLSGPRYQSRINAVLRSYMDQMGTPTQADK